MRVSIERGGSGTRVGLSSREVESQGVLKPSSLTSCSFLNTGPEETGLGRHGKGLTSESSPSRHMVVIGDPEGRPFIHDQRIPQETRQPGWLGTGRSLEFDTLAGVARITVERRSVVALGWWARSSERERSGTGVELTGRGGVGVGPGPPRGPVSVLRGSIGIEGVRGT